MENIQEMVFIPEPKKLWDYVVKEGKKVERGTINKLDDNDINTILGTMEWFGSTTIWMKQTCFDLKIPKFRVFDWLAMCVMSRNDDNREQNREALRVLVYSWLKAKGNVREFIDDLRYTDYDCDKSYTSVKFADEEVV